MKKIKKILISLLLILICLSPLPVFAESVSYVRINCGGNLFEAFSAKMAILNNELFICANDAAKVSGYELIEINDNEVVYYRSNENVKIKTKSFEDVDYVKFIEAMNALNVEVIQFDKAFYLRGLECTKNELYQLTDRIIQGFKFKVADTNDDTSKRGIRGAIMYDLIIKGGLFNPKTYTDYYGDTYKSLFKGFIEGDTSHAYLLSKDSDKISKAFSNLEKIDGEDNTITAISTIFKCISDPADTLLNEVILKSESSLKLGGLNISSQIKILDNIRAIALCNENNADMIKYVFEDRTINEEYISQSFMNVVNDFKKVNNRGSKIDYYNYFIKEEADTIINETLKATASESLKTLIPGYKTYKICSWVIDFIADEYLGFSDIEDFVKKEKCISELQAGLYSIYNTYRSDKSKLVNTKYTAMMYAMCQRLWFDALSKTDGSVKNDYDYIYEDIEKTIGQLINIPNRDLTFVANNKKVHNERLDFSMDGFEKIDITINEEEALAIANELIGRYTCFMNVGMACIADFSPELTVDEEEEIWNMLTEKQQEELGYSFVIFKSLCCNNYDEAVKETMKFIDSSLIYYLNEDYVVYNDELYFFLGARGFVFWDNVEVESYDEEKITVLADCYPGLTIAPISKDRFVIERNNDYYMIKSVNEEVRY